MIAIETVGRRLYFTGDTFAVKSQLKALGATFDFDGRKEWWIGSGKREAAEKFLAELSSPKFAGGDPNPVSRDFAAQLGMDPETPPGIVADRLQDADRVGDAARVRGAHELLQKRVYAKVEYKGRTYYVVAEFRDQNTRLVTRCQLTTLDCMVPFWVDAPACKMIKPYTPREKWDGGRYSNKTVTVYDTLGSLRAFRDSQQEKANRGVEACPVCRLRTTLIHDMEDGVYKCRKCCDMPAE